LEIFHDPEIAPSMPSGISSNGPLLHPRTHHPRDLVNFLMQSNNYPSITCRRSLQIFISQCRTINNTEKRDTSSCGCLPHLKVIHKGIARNTVANHLHGGQKLDVWTDGWLSCTSYCLSPKGVSLCQVCDEYLKHCSSNLKCALK
jgi:hypothetical protein